MKVFQLLFTIIHNNHDICPISLKYYLAANILFFKLVENTWYENLLLFHWLNCVLCKGDYLISYERQVLDVDLIFCLTFLKQWSALSFKNIWALLFCIFFYFGFHAETIYLCNVLWYWLIFVKQTLQNCSSVSFDFNKTLQSG